MTPIMEPTENEVYWNNRKASRKERIEKPLMRRVKNISVAEVSNSITVTDKNKKEMEDKLNAILDELDAKALEDMKARAQHQSTPSDWFKAIREKEFPI